MNTQLLQGARRLTAQPNWVRAVKSDNQSIRDLAAQTPYSQARKLFAIIRVSKTSPARRVLIFDNHPQTLAYLFPPKPDVPEVAPGSLALLSTWQFVSLLIFISVLVGVLSWLLFFH